MPEHPSAPPSPGSVTVWLGQLKTGNPAAVAPLWEAYFAKLVAAVRGRLATAPRAAADEEDVAAAAFHSFFRRVQEGRFPRLADRDGLWHLLLAIADRKAAGAARHAGRLKRGGGRVVHASAAAATKSGSGVLGGAAGRDPDPAEVAAVAEECRRLLGLLSEDLRPVAIWKLEGYTNAEIAEELDVAVATVERKLARIRAIWGRHRGNE